MSAIEGREDEEWDGEEGDALETEQLALKDEDDRLPWLEGADDDDYADEATGSGMGKLVLMGLAALVVFVGAIWWATHRNPDPGAEPDGSLVKADSQPYKEAPKDPGGKTFDGTGDSSFAVSEGQSRPAQLEQKSSPTPAPAPTASTAAKPVASGGVGVQVGAFSSKETAEAGWSRIVSQAGGVLSGVSHRIVAGSADNGTIYRLQAVAGDAGAANALCGKLKAAGVACQVK